MDISLKLLESVVLLTDLPEHSLRVGDLGTVVEVLADEAVEVEFLRASGGTQAVVTLPVRDLRPAAGDEVIAVRKVGKKT